MPKMLLFFFRIEMATQKFTGVDFFFFLVHADMSPVTMQSRGIVSNEVNDNSALLEPSYRKNRANLLVNLILTELVKLFVSLLH